MADFKKYFTIPAEPELVYAALTFKPTIELWTGAPAEFTTEAGSEFSMWDGNIVGKNLEFEVGKMIRQQWYFGDESTPSIVTLKIHPHKKGTSLEVNQTNIPEEAYEDMVAGWRDMYIKSLVDFYRED